MLDREGAAGPGDVAIVGDEDAVAAQILALADAGVTDFVAVEFARGQDRERTRGVLKAMVPRWLQEPALVRLVADVRTAHRRHGGSGALYVYLRKERVHS